MNLTMLYIMEKSFGYVLLLAMAVACSKQKAANTPDPYVPNPVVKDSLFSNPLLPAGPDPWVAQKDSYYYYTHTTGDRIRVWRTTAMSELGKATNQVIWSKPATGPNSQNIWAPELHYLDGKWYAYYTAGASPDLATQRTFVLENTSPDPFAGKWEDRGKLADPTADFFAIDATVLEHSGKKYLVWSGHQTATDNTQRLYIAQMATPYTLASTRVLISSPTYDWEKVGTPAVNEGPEILKGPTGKVFLIFSASGCWTDDYKLGLMTLKEGGDPMKAEDWTKSAQPVLVQKPEHGAYGPGHNGFFKSPDGKEDWIIYHANPQPGLGCADRRSPRMQRFSWNADGTPNFGEPVNIATKLKRPSGE
ncbi:family 43 glycosylhydrolase [Paracnuella aquatica]|uniref:glycoside hydrolase family 43 protein n=1 Tax=Paracnuella aquatica TaxID=2268757 RepID=UPI0019D4715F|nr:glycoside hydrolase family 43 protein [Paracnuella aquatica]